MERKHSPFITAVFLILICCCCFNEASAKNKPGKMVKNAVKTYTAHRAARSIWKIAFVIFMMVVAVIAAAACVFFVRRRLLSPGSEGFGLLREGP